MTEAAAAPTTILIVDGEVLARMVIAAYLRDCGYQVIEAANTGEARVVLAQPDLSVRVVLADAAAWGPGEGFSLATWIRRERPQTEVLLVGSPSRAAGAAGQLCEEGPQLRKPYDPQLVSDRIRRLLAERDRREREA